MEQAVAMAFLVPDRSLGLDHSIGSMKAGMRAVLIRFTPAWIPRRPKGSLTSRSHLPMPIFA